MGSDNTEPQHKIKALSDAELESLLFRNLMQHTTDSIYFKDENSCFIRISERQARKFGFKAAAEAPGKSDSDIFTEEHAKAAREDEMQIMATGQPMIGKEEVETWHNRSRTWVSSSKIPLRNNEGKIIGTFGVSRDITERKKAEAALRESELKLRAALESLKADLGKARVIQKALLPTQLPDHSGLKFAVRYEPMEAVGGDYFSISTLETGWTSVFIGDLMGHGVSAALYMALLKFITENLSTTCGNEPDKYLERANVTLMEKTPMTFITAVYCIVAPEFEQGFKRVMLAGAGHPYPIHYKAASGKHEMVELESNAALGITDAFKTATLEINCQPGDRLLFYTDGITETVNHREEMLGTEKFLEILDESYAPDLEQSLNMVTGKVTAFRGHSEVSDDVLLLGIDF